MTSIQKKYRYVALVQLILTAVLVMAFIYLQIQGVALFALVSAMLLLGLGSIITFISSFSANPHNRLAELIFFGL